MRCYMCTYTARKLSRGKMHWRYSRATLGTFLAEPRTINEMLFVALNKKIYWFSGKKDYNTSYNKSLTSFEFAWTSGNEWNILDGKKCLAMKQRSDYDRRFFRFGSASLYHAIKKSLRVPRQRFRTIISRRVVNAESCDEQELYK